MQNFVGHSSDNESPTAGPPGNSQHFSNSLHVAVVHTFLKENYILCMYYGLCIHFLSISADQGSVFEVTVNKAAENRCVNMSWVYTCVSFFFFFLPFLAALWHMQFLGQGSAPSSSCNLYHSCGNTRSFNRLCQARSKTRVLALQRHS